MRRTAATTVAILICGALPAGPQTSRPAYEVATIKPNDSGAGDSSTNGSRGQIVIVNQSLHRLIERAYNVRPFQVSGPAWMEDVKFDIAAKYPPDTSREDRPLMLRTLLEDRFGLSVHHDTKQMRFARRLAVSNSSPLRPTDPPEPAAPAAACRS